MNGDLGLETVGEEVLEDNYETDAAADPRVPSLQWEQQDGVYMVKVYSNEFLENDTKAVAGKTLEDIIKKNSEKEDDFYVQVSLPGEGLTPEREVYTFSEDEIQEGLREVIQKYAESI